MFDVQKFGVNLSRLRKSKDMTQSELADILNVTRQAISKYENGDSFPDMSILLLIADTFHVNLDELILSGDPTSFEKEILTKVAEKRTSDISNELFENANLTNDLINIAPLLKASTLGEIASRFKYHNIDISKVVELAEYINDETLASVLQKTNYEKLDEKMLEKFIPILDEDAKMIIFDKILDGELDWHLLKVLKSYTTYLNPLIENAVVCGVLDKEVLKMI